MSTKVGIVGCGNISEIYLKNSRRLADIEVVAVSDIDKQRAQARADEYPDSECALCSGVAG